MSHNLRDTSPGWKLCVLFVPTHQPWPPTYVDFPTWTVPLGPFLWCRHVIFFATCDLTCCKQVMIISPNSVILGWMWHISRDKLFHLSVDQQQREILAISRFPLFSCCTKHPCYTCKQSLQYSLLQPEMRENTFPHLHICDVLLLFWEWLGNDEIRSTQLVFFLTCSYIIRFILLLVSNKATLSGQYHRSQYWLCVFSLD